MANPPVHLTVWYAKDAQGCVKQCKRRDAHGKEYTWVWLFVHVYPAKDKGTTIKVECEPPLPPPAAKVELAGSPYYAYGISIDDLKPILREKTQVLSVLVTASADGRSDAHHKCLLAFPREYADYGPATITPACPPPPWPQSADQATQVPANLVAYGNVDPSSAQMSAAMVSQNQVCPGNAVAPPAGYNWAFTFPGLTSGVTYQLIVQAVTDVTDSISGWFRVQ